MYISILLIILQVFLSNCDEDNLPEEQPDINNKEYGYAGVYTFNKLFHLPAQLNESSGLLYWNNQFWTFNDGGDDPVLYGLDPNSGDIIRTITLTNAENTDWEDIAQDATKIYIGDFGNNDGDRTNLKVYLIQKTELVNNATNEVQAGILNFNYEDQENFTPAHFANSYDCEAFIASNDNLYLFTKDWINATTTLYTLPAQPGTFTAKKQSTFDVEGLLTGADFSAADSVLVFCGYENYVPFTTVFYSIPEHSFFEGEHRKIRFPEFFGSQIEGVTLFSKDSLYFSSEDSGLPQGLFLLNFKNF
ncbi:MAG: hypothetical protein JXJ22_15840 [Bacteroidales bacterium]|nr:hypothetical protein [Bacteroidales bacterium]